MRRPAGSHTGRPWAWRIISCKPRHPFRAATRHVLDMATWHPWPLTLAKHHTICHRGHIDSTTSRPRTQYDGAACRGPAHARPSHRLSPVGTGRTRLGRRHWSTMPSRPCHHGRRQLMTPRYSASTPLAACNTAAVILPSRPCRQACASLAQCALVRSVNSSKHGTNGKAPKPLGTA